MLLMVIATINSFGQIYHYAEIDIPFVLSEE